MRWNRLRRGAMLIMCIVLFFIPFFSSACGGTTGQHGRGTPVSNAHLNIENIIAQVLDDQNSNGWDEINQGILINWRRDDTARVNCDSSKCDTRDKITRHDPANDLRDLENLYWYRHRHPGDTSMNSYIARISPTVKQEWGNTTLNKGWIYYILRRLALYSDETAYWDNTARHWAQVQYHAIDPRLGVQHGPVDTVAGPGSVHLKDAYRVDHNLELGTALVDAGKRYQHPEWVTAGLRTVDVVTKQAFSPTYHLFNRIYLIHDSAYGDNKIFDYQARMGEQGQEIDALVRSGVYTQNETFLTLAGQMLDALQNSAIRDRTNGGFFFALYLGPYKDRGAGDVNDKEKESRQLHVLAALHLANQARANRWSALESELFGLATTPNKFLQPTPVPGYPYHLLPAWSQYPCSSCAPHPSENWVSAEANNIALESLQTIAREG